jgi:hypothetical protein
MILENCRKIVINNPFCKEDITPEEAEYLITKQDLDELRRYRLDKVIKSISSVVNRKFSDYIAEKNKELSDILQTETVKEKAELISELKLLEKKRKQLENELSVVNHKIFNAIEELVSYFNVKCHENDALGISSYGIKSYKVFLKKMACKTTLSTFATNHKVESEIWLNEKHDLEYLEKNRSALVEKYFEFLKKENEQYDVYNKIVYKITH